MKGQLNTSAEIVWLTGLPCAGKTTIANALRAELRQAGYPTLLLDGDRLRVGLCSDLDFSPQGRAENIRRAAEVAGLAAESGIITVAAFVSPYRADRALARTVAEPARFIEVFVNASVAVCEKRDVKGHYAAARAGRIIQFTGISAPYEPPAHPEIELQTDRLSVPECVARIIGYLFPVTL